MKIIKSKTPIISGNSSLYSSCTFDGEKYYFTLVKTNQVHIFDKSYHCLEKITLNDSYDNITYNPDESIFYLSSNTNIDSISRVNIEFNELKDSTIPEICEEPIISMGYSEKEKTLYIVNKNNILAIDENNENYVVLNRITTNNNFKKSNNILAEISSFTAITNIDGNIYVAYNRKNESYLAKVENGIILEEHYIDDNCTINNIIDSNSKINLFVINNYSYIYETNILVNDSTQNRNTQSRNYNCNYFCDDCQSDCDCNNECKCNTEHSICEIIESIALEEARNFSYIKCRRRKITKSNLRIRKYM